MATTYRDVIQKTAKAINEAGHSINYSIEHKHCTVSIDNIEWSAKDCDAVVALSAYLEGIAAGLLVSGKDIKL